MKYALLAVIVASAAHAQSDPYYSALEDQDKTCRGWYADAALDPIRQNFPTLSGGQATLEMLADQTKPNDQQRFAFLIFDKLITKCDAGFQTILSAYRPPIFADTHRRYSDASLELRAKFYAGDLTFGQYLSESRAAHRRFAERIDELDAQFAAAQQNAAAANAQMEAARRAAMGRAVSDALRNSRGTSCRPDGLGGVYCQ
jgi:hypothetical protein